MRVLFLATLLLSACATAPQPPVSEIPPSEVILSLKIIPEDWHKEFGKGPFEDRQHNGWQAICHPRQFTPQCMIPWTI